MTTLPAVITKLPQQLKASFVDIVRDKLGTLPDKFLTPILNDAGRAVGNFADNLVIAVQRR